MQMAGARNWWLLPADTLHASPDAPITGAEAASALRATHAVIPPAFIATITAMPQLTWGDLHVFGLTPGPEKPSDLRTVGTGPITRAQFAEWQLLRLPRATSPPNSPYNR